MHSPCLTTKYLLSFHECQGASINGIWLTLLIEMQPSFPKKTKKRLVANKNMFRFKLICHLKYIQIWNHTRAVDAMLVISWGYMYKYIWDTKTSMRKAGISYVFHVFSKGILTWITPPDNEVKLLMSLSYKFHVHFSCSKKITVEGPNLLYLQQALQYTIHGNYFGGIHHFMSSVNKTIVCKEKWPKNILDSVYLEHYSLKSTCGQKCQ